MVSEQNLQTIVDALFHLQNVCTARMTDLLLDWAEHFSNDRVFVYLTVPLSLIRQTTHKLLIFFKKISET